MEGKEVWEQFGDEGNVEQDPLVENDGAHHTQIFYVLFQNNFHFLRPPAYFLGKEYGKIAKLRSRLIALVIWRWCLAQVPVILLERILPLSIVKDFTNRKFL